MGGASDDMRVLGSGCRAVLRLGPPALTSFRRECFGRGVLYRVLDSQKLSEAAPRLPPENL